ncbi:DNA replication and repair protein RecO [Marinobacter daqiaonensis]|uniref:DNA repair protein RecO n=1 Tax=Marinobacter daqiaonensis TaxID=650891 RepID=A0A1I6J862_9GAMM|nr:DNA repair protein RecO [Marinobacter daqiaonensis]SFR75117.1 DNA replication and repair protein RecO [Marinobacter daqiaonensis]
MSGPVQQEPAYVLHRRPFRETSLLVDLFTLNHGRIGVVARGASGPKSALKAQLQPFQPLLVDWTGRSDLKTLTQADPRSGVRLGHGRSLYSGFYLNELLQKLLSPNDPSPVLFAAYIDALADLADNPDDVEPVLRRFEMSLARGLGYGFAWDQAMDTGEPVQAMAYYCYDPQQGILATPTDQARLTGLSGQILLDLAQGDLSSPRSRRLAKQVMRSLTDFLLQGKPLNSRALFAPQVRP